jgi:hypothetical protein
MPSHGAVGSREQGAACDAQLGEGASCARATEGVLELALVDGPRDVLGFLRKERLGFVGS